MHRGPDGKEFTFQSHCVCADWHETSYTRTPDQNSVPATRKFVIHADKK